jgi:hypothetical protein
MLFIKIIMERGRICPNSDMNEQSTFRQEVAGNLESAYISASRPGFFPPDGIEIEGIEN